MSPCCGVSVNLNDAEPYRIFAAICGLCSAKQASRASAHCIPNAARAAVSARQASTRKGSSFPGFGLELETQTNFKAKRWRVRQQSETGTDLRQAGWRTRSAQCSALVSCSAVTGSLPDCKLQCQSLQLVRCRRSREKPARASTGRRRQKCAGNANKHCSHHPCDG